MAGCLLLSESLEGVLSKRAFGSSAPTPGGGVRLRISPSLPGGVGGGIYHRIIRERDRQNRPMAQNRPVAQNCPSTPYTSTRCSCLTISVCPTISLSALCPPLWAP